MDLDPDLPYLNVEEVLSAISDGSIEPILNNDDDPSWADVMASLECKYWVAGG
jgi:hypothetical protein